MPTESDWEAARRFRTDVDAAGGDDGGANYAGGDDAGGRDAGADARDDALALQFASLADALFDVPESEGVAGLVGRVVAAALRIVPGADLVSVVMLCDSEEFETVARTDERAERADRIQHAKGAGPSLTAFETPGVALAVSDDLATESRWPDFCAHAMDEGLRSVLATGMFPGGGSVRFGALTFYSYTVGGFDESDREHALVLAAHVATAIAAARAQRASELLTAQLRTALDSRDVIGQAKGILMERRGLDADGAFDVLRRTSQDLNVKLRDVAQTLVARRTEL